jgi:hypothetical protein
MTITKLILMLVCLVFIPLAACGESQNFVFVT